MPKKIKSSKNIVSQKKNSGNKIVISNGSKQNHWQCGICSLKNSVSEPYCIQCYQTLYYYYYMEGFMFVEKDYESEVIQGSNSEQFKNEKYKNRNFPKLQSQNSRLQQQQINFNNLDYNKTWIQNVLLAD